MATAVHLAVFVDAYSGLCSGWIAIVLTQVRGKTMGIVRMYLTELLLELTLGPISTRSHE